MICRRGASGLTGVSILEAGNREGLAIPKRERLHATAEPRERAYLVAAELKHGNGRGDSHAPRWSGEASLEELRLLADTAGAKVVGSAMQRLDNPNPATYIG